MASSSWSTSVAVNCVGSTPRCLNFSLIAFSDGFVLDQQCRLRRIHLRDDLRE
jgi:hypothetical protein